MSEERLISANDLSDNIRSISKGIKRPAAVELAALVLIAEAPTIDAVKIVRCKDCKFLYNEPDDYCCMLHKGLVKISEESFCSYGKRSDRDN